MHLSSPVTPRTVNKRTMNAWGPTRVFPAGELPTDRKTDVAATVGRTRKPGRLTRAAVVERGPSGSPTGGDDRLWKPMTEPADRTRIPASQGALPRAAVVRGPRQLAIEPPGVQNLVQNLMFRIRNTRPAIDLSQREPLRILAPDNSKSRGVASRERVGRRLN